MQFRRVGLVLVGALVVATGGCSGNGSATKDRPSASATPSPALPSASPLPTPAKSGSQGPEVAGTGYRFRVPQGWRDVTSMISRQGVDRGAAAAVPTHGFTSNVNVVIVQQKVPDNGLGQVVETIRKSATGYAPGYAVRAPTTVAGGVAGHLSGLRSQDGAKYWVDQFILPHDALTYVVSFSFSPRIPAATRTRMIAGMLGTWQWLPDAPATPSPSSTQTPP